MRSLSFFILALTLLTVPAIVGQEITGYADPSKPEYWARTVGFWQNAQQICGVEYDPAKLEARTAEFAAHARISVSAIKRMATVQAEQAAPHFTDRSCRHAREQAKRLDLLPDGGWGSRPSATEGGDANVTEAAVATGGRWQDYFIGKTHLSFDPAHGTQLFFLDPDGRTYLFYPGNESILRGDWQWQGQGGNVALCFRYGANTYNPALGTAGGGWSCADPEKLARAVKERTEGDPFRLSGRNRVPFVLSPARTNLRDLYALFQAQ